MKAPWAFGTPPAPGRGVPNVPTPLGRALGEQLARLTDGADAELRTKHPEAPTRCDDCAFRLGTVPNGCPGTLMDAIKCVLEGEPFFCHKGVTAEAGPRQPCAGWVALVKQGQGG